MSRRQILVIAVFVSCLLPLSAFAENTITRWNELALETVRTERLGAAPASRVYAMVNAAMYDAVNGIDRARHKSRRDFAIIAPNGAPPRASRRVAAAAAAHAVLTGLYPSQSDIHDARLQEELNSKRGYSYKRGRDRGRDRDHNRALSWGAYVGQSVIDARSNDGSSNQEIIVGGFAPGEFRADFTSAQFRNMVPFAIESKAPYVSEGPPELTSPEYLAAHHEVRLLGDARYINNEYDEIFSFWAGSGGSARPPGEWIKIAITVAGQEQTTRSLSSTARLFALLGMALGDATIPTWESKASYRFWRPATAINSADTDGNPETLADGGWIPRNGSFGSSPEHTSGQSAYAGAGSTILAGFYCDNNIRFTFEGDNAIGGSRTFDSFSDAAAEAGQARIFAGIHFQFSNQAGQEAGRGVAREILDTTLRSRNGRSDCLRIIK